MLELARLFCPYPTISKDGVLRDGMRLQKSRVCEKCKTRECRSYVDEEAKTTIVHGTCVKGLSVVLCRFGDGEMLCNGIIVQGLNTTCPAQLRKKYKLYRVSWDEIGRWQENMSEALREFERTAEGYAEEKIHGLHDVKTAVSLVTRNAEAIIATLPGNTDEEKIENADDELKALLKSVQLLNARLPASSILANPEAASHGQKHPTPVHKVCFKMVRLFEEVARRKRCRVRMHGTSYATPRCYESFETIPLILIDNAVKYSNEEWDIVVTVQDFDAYVLLEVESHGGIVPEDMREAIFERGTRSPDSAKLVARGSGLGLHIATIVAKAHNFKILYECRGIDRNGVTGKNVFSCRIPL